MGRQFLILIGLIVGFTCHAFGHAPPPKNPPPISTVDRQVAKTQADFEAAKKMFNPYYAGPLLTPSANNVPPGHFNVQPYLFFISNFAQFNGNRHSVNITDLWQIKAALILQAGLTDLLDISVIPQGLHNMQGSKSATNFGDTQVVFGLQMMKEQPYRPAVRFTIGEVFPTGKYNKLTSGKAGVQATGAGSYATTVSLNFSKVIWWLSTHPIATRASFNYTVPTMVHVQGFNAYGGGFNTRGKIHPGNTIAIDTSIEFSFTLNWVLAVDLAYTYQNHSTFSGHKGRTAAGATASVGAPSNDSLSCAPAIEYNPTPHMGFLFGGWFTITGRNSPDFAGAILTMTYFW